MLSSIFYNSQSLHNEHMKRQLEGKRKGKKEKYSLNTNCLDKYMPCVFLLQEIRNVDDLDLEKKKLKIDELYEFLDTEGTIAGYGF